MASRGVNKVILVGNCGQDPESKFMPSGGAVTNISIATSETWKDKQTGAQQEKTEWHRVVFFNRLAEIVGEYVKKGSKLYIEGRLQTRKWQDQNGNDRYSTEIVANEMQMLDSRGGGDMNQGGGYGAGSQPQQQQPQQQGGGFAAAGGAAAGGMSGGTGISGGTGPSGGAPAQQQSAPSFDDFDDDIPF